MRRLAPGLPTLFALSACDKSSKDEAPTAAKPGDAPAVAAVKADGTFRIARIPAGSWHFIVGRGKTWRRHDLSGCCAKVESGGTFDVGDIRLGR